MELRKIYIDPKTNSEPFKYKTSITDKATNDENTRKMFH